MGLTDDRDEPSVSSVNAVPSAPKFRIEADVSRSFYTAASHRALIRSLRVTNIGHNESDRMIVSVRAEGVGAPNLLEPWRRDYPVPRQRDTTEIDTLTIRPNLIQLASLDEAIRGDVVISISVNGEMLETVRYPVDFLAYNQWFHSELDYEYLSAFVLPSHPVIVDLMHDVRRRLLETTGDGSTEGYQSGPDRVLAIMKAIYDELRTKDIKYSDPPASFEGYGQKIRTPDVIMREGVMTCLDSSVLVASCFAAAGLSPLLFIVAGHAFPGLWSSDNNTLNQQGLPDYGPYTPAVIANTNHFQNLDTAGMILSLESTKIGLPGPNPFEEALNRHKDFVRDKIHYLLAIVDVARASAVGVRRLPNRVINPVGEVVDVEIDDTETLITPEPRPDVSLGDAEDSGPRLANDDAPPRVRRWMDALLDISNSNSLVDLRSSEVTLPDGKKRQTRSIKVPMVDGLLGKIENTLIEGGSINLVPLTEMPPVILQQPTDEAIVGHFIASKTVSVAPIAPIVDMLARLTEELIEQGQTPRDAQGQVWDSFGQVHAREVARRFKALKKQADDIEAESATNQLFITVGSMEWESPGDTPRNARTVKSPLFVIPVRISGSVQSGFNVRMEEGADISPNYCLMEKLRVELGLRIEDLERPNTDDAGIDVDKTITKLRVLLGASKHASMKVIDDCQLAVLDFATFRMWKDLRTNWRLFARNTVVDHLVKGENASLIETTTAISGEPLTPFECDESQLEAVKWALEGRSFVLEGPPGTGKSQTIANIIAANMAEGRRILFVAEKKVALDGVYNKLEEIGLGPFCITMHHEETTPEKIRSQLREAIEFSGQDVSMQWDSESAVVKALQQRLDDYRDSVIEANVLGYSALSAVQESERLGDGIAIAIDPETFALIDEHYPGIRSALLQIRGVAGASVVQAAPEWSLASLENPDSVPKTQLAGALGDLRTSLAIAGPLKSLVEQSLQVGSMPTAARSAIELIESGRSLSLDAAREILSPSWMDNVDAVKGFIDKFTSLNKTVFDFFKSDAFQIDLSPQVAAATEAVKAGVLSRKKKAESLRKLVAPLARVPVTQEPAEILTLLQRVGPARVGLQEISTALSSLTHLPRRQDFDPLVPVHFDELRAAALELIATAKIVLSPDAEIVWNLATSGYVFSSADINAIEHITNLWQTVKSFMGVSASSQLKWQNGRSLLEAIEDSLDSWIADAPSFSTLSRIALVNLTLTPLRLAGQHRLVHEITEGGRNLDQIHEEFERGVVRASLLQTMNQGALATFDRSGFDRTTADFVRRDYRRRQLMRTVIPRHLAESRPFKAGIRTGAIGNLEKELGRKVRRVSLPKLIREHGERITRLAPCFLMSPEAVSRLLPAESQFFDLVIFDEASQIRVAAAIPAMGRGKSVVVVGDSKQMPPSKRIGQKQVASEQESTLDDDGVLKDLESILTECSESHLQSLMLKCHFRSQHEGLIAFSNEHFYDNKLVTFPAPNTDRTTPVSWFDVPDGEFLRTGEQKGTNPAEAKAVVAEIKRRLQHPEHASKSIGVVTFNEHQATHIMDLLEQTAATDQVVAKALRGTKKSDALFVVPLERVQGDERDTIMLSVSYSYQKGVRDKLSPTWGPLTHKGGERRLNVAITRARKDLLVFCSFDPNHVQDDGSKHLGVRATKNFLLSARHSSLLDPRSMKSRQVTEVDRWRGKLLTQLQEVGVKVRENVGLSKFRIDLTVADESSDQQFLAILLDNGEWSARSTPFDREVLPNSVLRLIGWRRVGRVWLKSSIDDPELVVRSVLRELARECARISLVTALRDAGFEVRDDSPLARIGVDLAIRKVGLPVWPLSVTISDPGLFAQFHNYEGDLPRPEMLAQQDCVEAISVWLKDLETDQAAVVSQLEQSYEAAAERMRGDLSTLVNTEPIGIPALETKPSPESISSSLDTEGPVLTTSEFWSEFQDARSLSVLGDQSALGPGTGVNPALVRRAIDEIVEFEGPIREDRLASILVGRFGMAKVKSARLQSLLPMFGHLPVSRTQFGTVYWPSTRPAETWRGFRTSKGDAARPIEEVPAEEVANAMLSIVRLGQTATADEIISHVAAAFGRRRITAGLRESLKKVLIWTVERGLLVSEGNYFKMP